MHPWRLKGDLHSGRIVCRPRYRKPRRRKSPCFSIYSAPGDQSTPSGGRTAKRVDDARALRRGAAPLAQGHSPRFGNQRIHVVCVCRPQAMSKRSASNGCPTWIRTMTRRVKVACATITPSGKKVRKKHVAGPLVTVKAGNTILVGRRSWPRTSGQIPVKCLRGPPGPAVHSSFIRAL